MPVARPLLLALAMLLAGCQSGNGANNQSAEAPRQLAELTGYGNIRFGMSFNEALAESRGDLFNPAAVVTCDRDMPLRGCLLSHNYQQVAPFAMRDGIPYTLSLSFNRLDHLTDIELRYSREDDISVNECLQLTGRTLDWLTRDYGVFGPLHSATRGETVREVRTPAGNPLPLTSTPDHGFVATARVTLRDGRRVDLLALTFPGSRGPNCEISINLGERDTVERPDLSEH